MCRVARCTSHGREPGAADFDQIGPLVRDDTAGRARREHEPVRLLGGNARAVEAIAADPARLEDLVAGTGDHDRLAEPGPPLHIARLLEEVRADAAGGLAEELGDVEDAEAGRRTKSGRQVETRDVQRGARARGGHDLEVQNSPGRDVSQSSPRAGRPCRSWGRGSCTRRRGSGPRSHSGGRGRENERPIVRPSSHRCARWSSRPIARAPLVTQLGTPPSGTDWSAAPRRWSCPDRGRCARWWNPGARGTGTGSCSSASHSRRRGGRFGRSSR